MENFKFVFVIVVYRNTKDIVDLLENIKLHKINTEVVIVNNYYDQVSLQRCKEIAYEYGTHFVNTDNKGYGYGNNRGIEFAKKNLKFDFLIVSNPDIEIKKFNTTNFSKYQNFIVGPLIKTMSGKNQNPYWFINNPIAEWLIYKGYKNNLKFFLYTGIAVNKIIREALLLILKLRKTQHTGVFAVHGSFLIFPRKILDAIGNPYDEEMFLFAEEAYLAHLLKEKKIKSILTKDIKVLHKEDGSMSLTNFNINTELKKSVLTYYSKLKKK